MRSRDLQLRESVRVCAKVAVLLGLCANGRLLAQVSFLGTQNVLPTTNLAAPYGVVEDAAGNIYVSDTTLHEVTCVTATGAACGAPFPMQQGLSEPKGMAIDGQGDLFVADAGAGTVVEIVHAASGYQQPVTLADSLNDPEAVALDPNDNLFVAVAGSGEVVELALGHGQYGAPNVILQGLGQPVGIAFDAYFTMYLSDADSRMIYTSKQQLGVYSTPESFLGIPSSNSYPGVPGSLMMDASMVLYVTDQSIHQVFAYQVNPNIPHPVASWNIGGGLQSPGQVAENAAGNIVLTDSGSGEVVFFSTQALPFMSQEMGAAPVSQTFLFTVAQGSSIGSIDVSTSGNLQGDFRAGSGSNCFIGTYSTATVCSVVVTFSPAQSGERAGAISIFDEGGKPLLSTYISGTGNTSRLITLPAAMSTIVSGLLMPTGIAVDGSGDVYVTDGETYTVTEYGQSGGSVSSPETLPIEALNVPMGMAVDGAGNLLVASSGNDRVIRMTWNGSSFVDQQSEGSGMYVPSGVAVAPDGVMCAANTYENQVNCYIWTGTSYVRQPLEQNYAAGGTFVTYFPLSVAGDGLGDVFWVQPYQNQVTEFNNSSQWVRNLWQGYFQFPTAVAVDGEGDLYVLDSGRNQVMMMVPVNGVYQKPVLVADGLNAPQGLAVDAAGNLYVADTGNHRVVKIVMTQTAPLVFTPTASGGNSTATQTIEVLSVGAQPATITGVSYPQDFVAASVSGSSASSSVTCAAGVQLQQGQGCTVSTAFAPQKANAQMQESIAITAQAATGQALLYTVPVQGTSANLAAQTIQFTTQAAEVYGQGMVSGHMNFPLVAKSSAGLPVTFAVVSGPGVISGGNTLEATGTGSIVVQAMQAGNAMYAAATPVEQTFTVLPATLTVTASNQQVVYGSSASSFGYTIVGFVGGDSGSVVSGNPTITSSAGRWPSVGSYPISIGAGTLTAANYTFVFVPGTLTVTPASLTLIPNAVVMTVGSAVPTLTYSAEGLLGADTLASATNGAPVLSTTATAQSPPGTYPIQIAAGTVQSRNYTLAFQLGVLLVTRVGNLGFNPPGGLAPPPYRLHGAPVLPFVGTLAEDRRSRAGVEMSGTHSGWPTLGGTDGGVTGGAEAPNWIPVEIWSETTGGSLANGSGVNGGVTSGSDLSSSGAGSNATSGSGANGSAVNGSAVCTKALDGIGSQSSGSRLSGSNQDRSQPAGPKRSEDGSAAATGYCGASAPAAAAPAAMDER